MVDGCYVFHLNFHLDSVYNEKKTHGFHFTVDLLVSHKIKISAAKISVFPNRTAIYPFKKEGTKEEFPSLFLSIILAMEV